MACSALGQDKLSCHPTAACIHTWTGWQRIDHLLSISPALTALMYGISHAQVVESHKPAQLQQPPIPQSKEALSGLPVRELKTMLQARHISYTGAFLCYLPKV